MPSLKGMKGSGFYNHHSGPQRNTLSFLEDWIRISAEQLNFRSETSLLNVVDYGCGEGQNSILAMNEIVNGIRRVRKNQNICVIHNDLPENDFYQLFKTLHSPSANNYLYDDGILKPNTYSSAVCGSFYDSLMPPWSVNMGACFHCLHWLDRVPHIPVPHFITYFDGSAQVVAEFARQAEQDLKNFLGARFTEMAKGGKLLLAVPARNSERRCGDGVYHVLNDACLDLLGEGLIDRALLERFVIPVYFRSEDELKAPIIDKSSEIYNRFSIDRMDIIDVPTGFEENLKATGDTESYANDYANFLRAFTEPLFLELLQASNIDIRVSDELYARVHHRLKNEPGDYTFRNIEIIAILTRN